MSYDYKKNKGNDQAKKKHSGCRMRQLPKMKFPIIFGWMYKGGAIISLYATEYAKSKETKSEAGKRWVNLFVRLTNKTTMRVEKMSGLLNLDNGKLYIKDLNLIANPKAPNGGYFGVQIKKTYNNN
jgi:hypothetical protein